MRAFRDRPRGSGRATAVHLEKAGDVGRRDHIGEAQFALGELRVAYMFVADKGDDEPVGAGPPGAARAVHVVGGIGGRVVVDHEGHGVDVDAPGRDVGGHQDVEPAGLECGQGALALALAAVAVDGGRPEAGAARGGPTADPRPRLVRQNTRAGPRAETSSVVTVTSFACSTRQKWWCTSP